VAAVLRWQCLEAGCDVSVTAGDEEGLVEAANEHVAAAHDSYELEDVILAAAEEVDGNG
jgi:Protein of unknown function (DUF1059)